MTGQIVALIFSGISTLCNPRYSIETAQSQSKHPPAQDDEDDLGAKVHSSGQTLALKFSPNILNLTKDIEETHLSGTNQQL